MKRTKLGLLFVVAFGAAVWALPASANHPPGPPSTLTICHKQGTPAEKTLTLPHQAAMSHVSAHGDTLGACKPPPCQGALADRCIDADGFVTAGDGIPAAAEVIVGDALSSFPDGPAVQSGLDLFDRDGNGVWTFGAAGDDLHAEDPSHCPGAIRNAVHDATDCDVLDINGDLANGTFVSCDLEVGAFNCFPGFIPAIKYRDNNGDGSWASGEDIVLDGNNNGIFD